MDKLKKLTIQLEVLEDLKAILPKRKHSRFRDGDAAIDYVRDLIEHDLPLQYNLEAQSEKDGKKLSN